MTKRLSLILLITLFVNAFLLAQTSTAYDSSTNDILWYLVDVSVYDSDWNYIGYISK
jgi:uncharacterized protein YjdB